MSFSVHTLPYSNNLEALAHYFEQQDLTLLDSPTSNHPDGRWTILAANPLDDFSIFDNDASSIETLKAKTKKLESKLPKVDCRYQNLPFTGGVIGICSYDLGITERNIDTPFAVDRKTPLAVIRLFNWAFLWDHLSQAAYLVHHHTSGTNTCEELIEIYNNAIKQTPNAHTENEFFFAEQFEATWTRHDYEKAFNQTKQYILQGDVYQINLAQHYHAHYKGQPLKAFFNLKDKASAPFSCYWHNQDWQLVSATPERFISVESKHVTTKPIKGTRPNLGLNGEVESLALSTKDKAENVMIVDLLRNDLSKHCHDVHVPSLFNIETFPTVHHMVSTVCGTLNKNSRALDVFWNAFPGGSITGAPKKRAMEIIRELESGGRSFYCGSLFYSSTNDHFDSNILIRSFIFEKNKIHCWAGGGIVADSQSESEYQECSDKIEKLMAWLSPKA